MPREFADNLLHALEDLKQSHETVPFEYTMRQAGVQRWFEARLVPSADNQVVVVDSDLNPIASHLVAKKQSSLLPLDIKVEPLPRGPNEFPDLLVLGESAQVLRLTRHGW